MLHKYACITADERLGFMKYRVTIQLIQVTYVFIALENVITYAIYVCYSHSALNII